MCGIVGLYYRDGRPVDAHRIDHMGASLAHRGPDGVGAWVRGSVGLGHRRLSIRDLSAAGRQPFSDPSGRIVVSYNGEIYNEAELKRELRRDFGVQFQTACDTEILPHGYLAWGKGMFERLEGMFAIALWDSTRRKLLLGRDGVGIKPLFYSANEHIVRFGSEIKALLADDEQPRIISKAGLHRFFAMGYVGPERTTLEGVRQVPPGHVLTFGDHDESEGRFWTPRRAPVIKRLNEAVEAFEPIWSRVVRDQLVSDVPVGVLQSGGIDSTLVSAEASRWQHTPLFTAGFSQQSFDESEAAGVVAKWLGLPLNTIAADASDTAVESLQRVIHHNDGQGCDEASIPLFLLSREVRRHVTVVLSGDGGDEAFGGYPTYRASRVAAALGPFLPRGLLKAFGRWASGLGCSNEVRLPASAIIARLALGIGDDPATAHTRWRRLVPQFQLDTLYGDRMRAQVYEDPFAEYRFSLDEAGGSLLDRCLLADQRFHLPGGLLAKADAMSMAHSLEMRVPFLDRRIMDFAGSCDGALLADLAGTTKRVLRAAARRRGVPDRIANAPKRGFNTPIARLLRTGLRTLADEHFDRCVEIVEPYLSAAAVRRLWRQHRASEVDHSYTLWPILTFAIWRRQMEQPIAASVDGQFGDDTGIAGR
jgi:asparagine synthase (glutamine-hydrolysing)